MISHKHDTIIGNVPQDWGTKTLSEVLSDHFSGDWGTDSGPNPANVLRSTNFADSGSIDFSDVAVRFLDSKQIGKVGLRADDLLLERSGGGPGQPVGRIAFVRDELPHHTVSNFVEVLRPDSTAVVPRFLGWVLFWLNQSGIVERLQTQTTQLCNLTFRDYLRVTLPSPSLDEQTAIARIIDAVDRAIDATRTAIDKAQYVKRALTQRLFSEGVDQGEHRKSEVGTIPAKWVVVRVAEVLIEAQYGLSMPMNGSGRWPILRMAAIQDGDVSLNDLKYVDLTDAIAQDYVLRRGDILFNRTNSAEWVGKVGIYRHDTPAVFASYLIRLKPDPSLVDSYFLGQLLASYAVQCRIRRYATPGVNQVNINATNLQNVRVALPIGPEGLDEQKRIAEVLEHQRQIVSDLEHYADVLERLKRGLMQDLLTGSVRPKIRLSSHSAADREPVATGVTK